MDSQKFTYTLEETTEFPAIDEILGKQKHYVTLTEEEKFKGYNNDSWYIFPPTNKIRKFWITVADSWYFELFIIIVIIINSLLLGVYDYENPGKGSIRNQIVENSEPVFIVIFTCEWIIKIIAQGFILDKFTYLRDAWNVLDFFVVLTSLLSVIPSMTNVSVIRTFRLFRPLRSFTSLPAMKSIVSTIISSMGKLGEIMIVAVIFFYIFSILGVTLWSGSIHKRWYTTPEPVNGEWVLYPNYTRNCDSQACPDGSYWGSLLDQYKDHPETLNLTGTRYFIELFFIYLFLEERSFFMNLTFILIVFTETQKLENYNMEKSTLTIFF